MNRRTNADKASKVCNRSPQLCIFQVIPSFYEGEHNKTAEPDSVHRRTHWNDLQEGQTMQHSTQLGLSFPNGAPPRSEERTYRAVTVAAILMVLASVWVF